MISEKTIQEAVERLVAAANPNKIILFGSYARGDATEDSDLDLMVIAHEVPNAGDFPCAAGSREIHKGSYVRA